MFIGPNATWRFGLFAGFMTGLTFVSTALGVIYLFEFRSLRLWLINAGYQIVIFSLMGVVLGAWT
jgi:fluoride ion exporter CrcB/FEX